MTDPIDDFYVMQAAAEAVLLAEYPAVPCPPWCGESPDHEPHMIGTDGAWRIHSSSPEGVVSVTQVEHNLGSHIELDGAVIVYDTAPCNEEILTPSRARSIVVEVQVAADLLEEITGGQK